MDGGTENTEKKLIYICGGHIPWPIVQLIQSAKAPTTANKTKVYIVQRIFAWSLTTANEWMNVHLKCR